MEIKHVHCDCSVPFPTPEKGKAEQEEILEQLRDLVWRGWKAARTQPQLPTPSPTLPGEGCLEAVKGDDAKS